MGRVKWIGLGILISVGVAFVGLGFGWLMVRRLWNGPTRFARVVAAQELGECGSWTPPMGPGMMGRVRSSGVCGEYGWQSGRQASTTCGAQGGYGACLQNGQTQADGSDPLTIAAAREAVEGYVAALGYDDLEIAELMEFEQAFYALVRESDTDMGAMELLVDKWSGAVGPEMGPNMMWNARYGMHPRGRVGGAANEANALSGEEALEIAGDWLEEHRPGETPEEHVDPFYGYYTIHTLKDDQIAGMLSVHASTGQVWYHTWHGDFIQ